LLRVAFFYAHEARAEIVAGEHLGALLVSYCIKARIPLPRHSDKCVRVQASAIVVVCITHYNDPPQMQ
jgi:hypothetical protein